MRGSLFRWGLSPYLLADYGPYKIFRVGLHVQCLEGPVSSEYTAFKEGSVSIFRVRCLEGRSCEYLQYTALNVLRVSKEYTALKVLRVSSVHCLECPASI